MIFLNKYQMPIVALKKVNYKTKNTNNLVINMIIRIFYSYKNNYFNLFFILFFHI